MSTPSSKAPLAGNVAIIARHSAVYSIAEILKKGIGFLLIPLYTHYLTPSDYGVIEVLNLILEVLGMLVGVRIVSAQTRYYHLYPNQEDKREVFTTALIGIGTLSVTSMIFLLFMANWIASVTLGSDFFAPHYRIVILCLVIQNIFIVSENDLIIRKKSIFYSILVIILMLLSLSLNILFLKVFHLGVWAILWSLLITKIVNLAVVPITLRKTPLRFSWTKFLPMVRYSLPLIPASLAMFALHFSDRLFLQHFCSLSEVGIYSLGYKFGMIISVLIATPFQRVWGTHSFEIERNPNSKKTFAKVFTYFAAILFFSAMCICVFITDVLALVAPPEYARAALIVPIIVLSYLLMGLNNAAGLGILISNKTRFIAFIQIPTAGLNLLLNFLLVPAFNIYGAAIATLISFSIMFAATMLISQSLYPIAYEYRRLMLLAASAFFVFFLSKLSLGSSITQFVYHLVLILAMPAGLYALKFFSKDELTSARQFVCRFLPLVSRK